MSELGRFGHHANPAMDFCVEVHAIEQLIAKAAMPSSQGANMVAIMNRVAKAMEFSVGGDQRAIDAKAELRAICLRLSPISMRDARQSRAEEWALAAFGEEEASSPEQRGLRLAEEAIEAAQAVQCDRAQLHRLVDFVYDRPVGELSRELGGVGLTLLCLAAATKLSADTCESAELDRVLSKPLAHFTARNEAKNEAGFRAQGSAPL